MYPLRKLWILLVPALSGLLVAVLTSVADAQETEKGYVRTERAGELLNRTWRDFTQQPAGRLLSGLLVVLSVVAVGFGIWRTFRAATKGTSQNPVMDIIKEGLWPFLVAGILVWPQFIFWIVDIISILVTQLLAGFADLFFAPSGEELEIRPDLGDPAR